MNSKYILASEFYELVQPKLLRFIRLIDKTSTKLNPKIIITLLGSGKWLFVDLNSFQESLDFDQFPKECLSITFKSLENRSKQMPLRFIPQTTIDSKFTPFESTSNLSVVMIKQKYQMN